MILAACSGPDTASDPPNLYGNIEHLAAQASAQVSRDDGWTIVALTEKGERVFWFVAPDVNGVSPALFKKTIKAGASSQQQTVIVSECEAPKQTCDDLAIKFESLSKKYK